MSIGVGLRAHKRELLKDLNRHFKIMMAVTPDRADEVLRCEINVVYAILFQTPFAAEQSIHELILDHVRSAAHKSGFDEGWVKERIAFAAMQGAFIRLAADRGALDMLLD